MLLFPSAQQILTEQRRRRVVLPQILAVFALAASTVCPPRGPQAAHAQALNVPVDGEHAAAGGNALPSFSCRVIPGEEAAAAMEEAARRGEIIHPALLAPPRPAALPSHEDRAPCTAFPTPDDIFAFEDSAGLLVGDFSDAQLFALMTNAANAVVAQYGDNFDFIAFWVNFTPSRQIGAAFYLRIFNETAGLGLNQFNNRSSMGLAGNEIEGFVMMWNINSSIWQPGTDSDAANFTRLVLAQEFEHRFAMFLPNLPDGRRLQGESGCGRSAHWNWKIDGQGSGMEMREWIGSSPAVLGGDCVGFAPDECFNTDTGGVFSFTDLYLMGYVTPDEMDEGNSELRYMNDSCSSPYNGPISDFTSADIIAAAGSRNPGFGSAQKHFRTAWVMIHQPGAPPTAAQLDKAVGILNQHTLDWNAGTLGRGTMCNILGAGDEGIPKFSQRPFGQGENVASNIDWTDEAPNVVVGDDFVSDGRPITGVRWWGSAIVAPPTAGNTQNTSSTSGNGDFADAAALLREPQRFWPGRGGDGSAAAAAAGACQASPVVDGEGDAVDTFGEGPPLLDIDTVDVSTDGANLLFSITFHTPVSPPSGDEPDSVGGALDLDTDQNPATGVTPLQNVFSPPFTALNLGIDFFVDLFSEASHPGFVDVLNAANVVVGTVPITFGPQSLSGSIPLSTLSGDDGIVDFTAIIGTFSQPTDALEVCGANGTGAECGDDEVNQPGEQCDGTDDAACPGECREDCTCPPPPGPDGWLISFHEPLEAGASAAPPVGLYFCDASIVRARSTTLPACDGHPVIEYFAQLSECCLIHAEADARSGALPAQREAFFEEECFDYALDIQAVIGHRFEDDGSGNCVETPTDRSADGNFWGWHTSNFACGAGSPIPLQPALRTSVVMSGTDWLYGPWASVSPVCSEANMAFELLTADLPVAGDRNGNCVSDLCDCPEVPAPQPGLPEAGFGMASRTIGVQPAFSGRSTALKVVFRNLPGAYGAWNGRTMWLSGLREVTEQSNEDDATPPTFKVSGLSCSPECRDWVAAADGEPIHVVHEGIVPGAQFDLVTLDCDCAADSESLSQPVATSRFGDVAGTFTPPGTWLPPDGNASVAIDVLAGIDKLLGKAQPSKARVDVVGFDPPRQCVDLRALVGDVLVLIDGALGKSYPFAPTAADPCQSQCP